MPPMACNSFWVARPDNPLAEPNCFPCCRHLREHNDQVANDLLAVAMGIETLPFPREVIAVLEPDESSGG